MSPQTLIPPPESNPAPSAETSPIPSAEVSPNPSEDEVATPNQITSVSPSPTAPTSLPQSDIDATKEEVIKRINALPGTTAEEKANLVAKMYKARSMERLAAIPFDSGQTTLRKAAADQLVRNFETAEMRDKLRDPTIVLVAAGRAVEVWAVVPL
jgi:hypothetical protein